MGLDAARSRAAGEGAIPVIAESDADALPTDDRWYAVLGAPRHLRVLRIAEPRSGAPPPRYAALALDPGGNGASGFAVETTGSNALLELTRSRADVVLLDDVASLSGDAEARLKRYVRDGGGLVVALGPHADPDYYTRRLFPGLVDLTLGQPERATEGSTFELRARSRDSGARGTHPGCGLLAEPGAPIGNHEGRAASPRARCGCRRPAAFRSS